MSDRGSIKDHDGQVVNVLEGITDLTESKQAEEALQKSLQRLEFALQGGNLGMWEWNPQDGAVAYSDLWAQMLEYRPDEVEPTVEFFKQHVHPEDLAAVLDRLTGHVEGRLPVYDSEHRIRTKSGRWLWVLDRGKIAERDKDGRPVRVTGLIADITQRKEAEDALRERIKEMNAFYHLSSLVEKPAMMLDDLYQEMANVLPQSWQYPEVTCARIVISGREFRSSNFAESRWHQSEIIWVNGSEVGRIDIAYIEEKPEQDEGPFLKEERMLIHAIAERIGHITERKRAEEALRQSEDKFSKFFHASPVVMSVTTFDDGVFLDVNEYFLKLLQLDRSAVIGKKADEIGMWQRSSRRAILDELERFGFAHSKEVELVLPSGRILPLLWFGDIVNIQGKRCIIASGFDLTERKSAEEERKRLEGQLRHAHKMEAVGTLAGGIAHEFNNMLSIISGNTEIALEDLDSHHSVVHNLHEISKAAKRSAELTRQLLAFARKQTIAPEVVNLNHLIEGMLKILERLIGENIDLSWHPKMDLWSVKVDPSQIDHILANLCVNARDSIEGTGKLTIETDNVHFDEAYCHDHIRFIPGDFVLIAVSDDGCGMEKETLDNLFDPFFTTKDVGQGTGLGMATVYGVVKQNHGFINVYSEPSQGTTIKVYLPRHTEPVLHADKSKSFETVAKGDETILVVEDEQPILQMIKMMLERFGYSVLAANSPTKAIRLAESYPDDIHMLITDVVMPDMSGKELVEKLTRLYPNLKCLFMSGYTANVIAHNGILDDGVHFINKPFSKQDISIKVREVLDESKSKTDA